MIRIEGLSHNYTQYGRTDEENTEVTALCGVDMAVKSGQFIAILGHNGSGKSTLAKHLNVLLSPTEGSVWIDGKDTREEKNLWDIRSEVGMVFQNPDNQIIGATVEEDVAFGMENRQMEPAKIREQIDRCLDLVSLREKKYVNPLELSGGQKQKAAVAGAIAALPKCLVLDEATAMLDPQSRDEIISIAHTLKEEHGMTVILITHYMNEAVDADHIYIMEQGKIVMQGSPLEIFDKVDELYHYKLEVPPVVKLGFDLAKNGFPIRTPVLHTEDLIKQLQKAGGL